MTYNDLDAKQRESFNFQKVSGVLADFGFWTLRLSDDWRGADFIAQHLDGETFIRVQLKGRLSFDRKYEGKGLWICFPEGGRWYLYPHDELLRIVIAESTVAGTASWRENGVYNFPRIPTRLISILAPYALPAVLPSLNADSEPPSEPELTVSP